MANAGHRRYAASRGKRWMTCAGSVVLEEELPRGGSSSYAQLGTAAHALLERCLTEGSEPSEYMGRIVVLDENGEATIKKPKAKMPTDPTVVAFIVDQDMVEAIDVAVEYVRSRMVELGVAGFDQLRNRAVSSTSCKAVEFGGLLLERTYEPVDGRPDVGGTADITLNGWDVLEVVDYKHGSGVFVPVRKNAQLMLYLLGAARHFGMMHSSYRITIVQPRHPDGRRPQSQDVTLEELLEFEKALHAALERCAEAEAMRAAGASVMELFDNGMLAVGDCDFCPMRPTCPATLAKVADSARLDFSSDPPDAPPSQFEMPDVFELLRWVPFVKAWAKAVEAEADRLARQGIKSDLFKMVRGRANRAWAPAVVLENGDDDLGLPPRIEEVTDELRRAELAVELGFVPADKWDNMFSEPELLSGPKIEKLVPSKQRAEFSRRFMTKPEGQLILVPVDDPREAVDPSTVAAEDFDTIPIVED